MKYVDIPLSDGSLMPVPVPFAAYAYVVHEVSNNGSRLVRVTFARRLNTAVGANRITFDELVASTRLNWQPLPDIVSTCGPGTDDGEFQCIELAVPADMANAKQFTVAPEYSAYADMYNRISGGEELEGPARQLKPIAKAALTVPLDKDDLAAALAVLSNASAKKKK